MARVFGMLSVGVLATTVLAVASSAGAQSTGDTATVTAAGAFTLTKQPDVVRMAVVLTGKGKDLAEAMSSLSDRRAASRAQVAALGAVESTIKISGPRIGASTTDQQRRMQQMVMNRLQNRGGAGDDDDDKPEPVTVSVTLSAEWKLEGGEPEAVLVYSHALQEKIKAADLAGLDEDKELSEEEEELAEEMQGFNMYGGMPQAKPGEPSFVFVASITDEELASATREAFGRARSEATRLAGAAGAKLGSVRTLSSTKAGVDSDNQYAMMAQYMSAMMQQGLTPPDTGSAEATSPQFGELQYQVTVSAKFALIGAPSVASSTP